MATDRRALRQDHPPDDCESDIMISANSLSAASFAFQFENCTVQFAREAPSEKTSSNEKNISVLIKNSLFAEKQTGL